MMSKKLLALLALVTIASMLAACGATPEPQTIVETVIVEKEGQTIIETVEVEVEKEVVVTQEVEVEKEVEVEVVVTATPEPVEQVIIGGFDVGPGGAPQTVPYMSGAGHIWYSKMLTPIIMMNSDYTEHTADGSLSTSWESNEDATVWTFYLREGVKWHDGEPFTADDVKFTAEFVYTPGSPATFPPFREDPRVVGLEEYQAGEADEIAGVVVVDDYTVEIQLTEPNPRFYDTLRHFYILPEHAIDFEPENLDTADWWLSGVVGTGPFKLSRYEKDQFMELVPNEDYWDGAPKLDKLVNRYFVDETAAVLALSSGDIDFTYVSADVAARFRGDDRYQIFEGPSFVTNVFNYNYYNEPWNDIRVRQALLYGIDRQSIINDVFNGTAQADPCHDPFPNFWPEGANMYEYDPDKARALLDEAAADGVDVSGEYEILTYYTSELAKDILTVMQANLADIGFNVVPQFLDVATWRQRVNTDADFDIAYRGNGSGPVSYAMAPYYREDNQWGVVDAEYTRLLDEMDAAMDPDAYTAARTALCQYQNDQATFGYWWVSTRYGVAASDLVDFYFFPAPGGGPYVDNSHLWSK
jgi:peptide/nickel transport system substrate-binding protein